MEEKGREGRRKGVRKRTAVEARHTFALEDGLGGGDGASVKGAPTLKAGLDHV